MKVDFDSGRGEEKTVEISRFCTLHALHVNAENKKYFDGLEEFQKEWESLRGNHVTHAKLRVHEIEVEEHEGKKKYTAHLTYNLAEMVVGVQWPWMKDVYVDRSGGGFEAYRKK